MNNPISSYEILAQTQRQRVSDGETVSLLNGCEGSTQILVLVWPQLGDFDSLEYAWWLQREANTLRQRGIAVRAVGIGDRASGQKFCAYTGFPAASLFVDETTALHRELGLYQGLTLNPPGLQPGPAAWLNLKLDVDVCGYCQSRDTERSAAGLYGRSPRSPTHW
jgi:hypothetical protein